MKEREEKTKKERVLCFAMKAEAAYFLWFVRDHIFRHFLDEESFDFFSLNIWTWLAPWKCTEDDALAFYLPPPQKQPTPARVTDELEHDLICQHYKRQSRMRHFT